MEPEEPKADLIAVHAGPSPDPELVFQVETMIARAFRGMNSGVHPVLGPKSDAAISDLLRSNPNVGAEEWLAAIRALAADLRQRGRHRSQPAVWTRDISKYLPRPGEQ